MKQLLLTLLTLALLIELVLTILCFVVPHTALELFGMPYNEATHFLGYIIAWFCLLVTVYIAYIMYLLYRNHNHYTIPLYILSIWWLGLGIGIYIVFGKADNLLLDTAKGALLILVQLAYAKQAKAT